VVVDLAKAFHRAGHHSLVCTTMFGGELVQELELSGIPFQCLGLKKSYDLRALLPVMNYLKENKIDAVITHGSSGCLIPRIASVLIKSPVIIHVEHNISDHKKPYQVLVNKILASFTDKVICISESARESLVEIEKIDAKKIAVIRNGLNVDRFKHDQSVQKKVGGPKRVGIVGRFMEQKGHIYFLEALAEVVKTIKNVEIIFVGDGVLKEVIEQKARQLGLFEYCNFLGLRSDVDQLLQTFDIFVLSSLWEGLPISLLEAQYFGVASIATNVGGIPEVITDGYNGLLVPEKDPAALASAMLKILIDDNLRQELGRHGKEVFAHKFASGNMANAYLDLTSEILREKGLNS
jgi:glycosyltransferase involved in cell wall biosynthesis